MRHFRLRDYGDRLYRTDRQPENETLCKIDLDKESETPTTRDWAAVTCPKCLKIKAECDKIGQKRVTARKD